MKLNWFSPLPPARSAIATYAETVLPELNRYADVVVWSEDPNAAPIAGIPTRHYRAAAPPWDALNAADLSVYHIGNHPLFHDEIWEVSRRQPGLVVLHDARLLEFVLGCAARRGDRDGCTELMRRHYGARGAAAADDIWTGLVPPELLVDAFPLTPAFTENALGVVVHSDEALQLAEPQAAGPLVPLALPYRPQETTNTAREWRSPFRLVMFGFLGGERGMADVLAALAAFPERDAFHLDVYGELPGSDDWLEQVKQQNLGTHVTIHGYVSAPELDQALARAHLAFNLRYPSRGEASFSLLQAWDHALPVVVHPIGWFAEIPPTCVAFAERGRTQAEIIRHLRGLLADTAAYRRIGNAARERLRERHSPTAYAERLAQFAEVALAGRTRCAALTMADRTAAALRQVAGGEADGWVLERLSGTVLSLVDDRRTR